MLMRYALQCFLNAVLDEIEYYFYKLVSDIVCYTVCGRNIVFLQFALENEIDTSENSTISCRSQKNSTTSNT